MAQATAAQGKLAPYARGDAWRLIKDVGSEIVEGFDDGVRTRWGLRELLVIACVIVMAITVWRFVRLFCSL
jgi:hypothetical protein